MKLNELFNIPRMEQAIPMPCIIAEAGVNHEGNMDLARRLIDEAAEGGADVIKFQTYRAETLASKNSPAYWDTSKEKAENQYELFKKHDSFWKNEFEILKKYCDSAGITFLSTPFDLESASFLNDLMDVFKISSSDITNKPFIRTLCNYRKPILLSTGASTLYEITEAVEWIEEKGNPLALLHCVLNYPTSEENAALGMIPALKRHFPKYAVGYSDHTLPRDMQILVTATLLGARVLEKHFTYDKTLPGNDHYHAMDKDDLKRLKAKLRAVLATIGDFTVRSLPDEEPARLNARRSLVTARSVPKGKQFAPEDLTWKRPAHGLSPKFYEQVLTMCARRPLDEDTVLNWTDLDHV